MNNKIISLLVIASSMALASCGGKSSQNSSSSDTGSDTASTDTGSSDTGSSDTGSTDTGSSDTGTSTDSGTTDTGSTDTGSTDTTPPHEHTPSSEWSKDENNHWHTCGGCNEILDLAAHTFVDEVTAPTYEAGGYTTHTCSVCGYFYRDSETDKLEPVHEHTPSSNWSKDATNHWHTCSGCDELLDVAAHTFVDVVTEPTYEAGGYTTHTCSICGYFYRDSETDKLEPAAQTYNISTRNLTSEMTISVVSTAKSGSQVVVTASSSYAFYSDSEAEAYFLYVNDTLTKVAEWEDKNLYYQFTMPAGDVELVLVKGGYSYASGYKFNIVNSTHIKAYGVDPSSSYSYISAKLIRTGNYAIDYVTVNYGSGETKLTKDSDYTAAFNGDTGDFSAYSFSGNATIKIYEKAVQSYNITYTNGDKIISGLPTSAISGETVSIRCSDLVYATGWTYNNDTVASVTASGSTVTTNSNSYGSLSFTMPSKNVSITFKNLVQTQSFNITKDAHVKSVSITDYSGNDKSHPSANDGVYIRVECEENYILASIKLNGTELSYNSYYNAYYGYTSSTDGAVNELVITTRQAFSVTTTSVEGGSIELSGSVFAAGATVTGTVKATSKFYTLTGIKVLKDGVEDNSVVISINTSGYNPTISFTMPEYSITLVPEFSKEDGSHFANVSVGEGITYWRIMGESSFAVIESTMTTEEIAAANFVAGEMLQIQVEHEDGYTVSVKLGSVTMSTPTYTSDNSAYFMDKFKMVDNATIELKSTAKPSVNITIERPTGCENATIKYLVNGKLVDKLYNGDEFKIICTGDNGAGKGFVAKAYTLSGTELSKNYYGDAYVCSGAFKVVVSLADSGTVTVNQCCTNVNLSIVDYNNNTIEADASLNGGTLLTVTAYVLSKHHINITVGGVTVVDKDLEQFEQGKFDVAVNGNVVITFTDIAS